MRGHRRAWQAQDGLGPLALALAVETDRAAVKSGEQFHDRQPDAKSALAAVEFPVCLCEQLEDERELISRDADARITDPQDHVLILDAGDEKHRAALWSELDGVAHQVADHLFDAHGVCVDERIIRHVNEQLHVLLRGDGGERVDDLPHAGAQIHDLFLQGDGAAGQAGHVEQIIHQPGDVRDLALHHRVSAADHFVRRLQVEQLQPGP